MNVIARLNNNELVSIKMVHTQTVEKFLKKNQQTEILSLLSEFLIHHPSHSTQGNMLPYIGQFIHVHFMAQM